MIRNKYFTDWKWAGKYIDKLLETVKIGKVIQKGQVYITIFGGDELNVFGCIPTQYRERVVKRCQSLVHELIEQLEANDLHSDDPLADVNELCDRFGAASIEQMFRKFIFMGRF